MGFHINISVEGFGSVDSCIWALKTLISNMLIRGNYPRIEQFGYKDLHVKMEITESPKLPKTGEISNSNF